jgi:hypothetical protein
MFTWKEVSYLELKLQHVTPFAFDLNKLLWQIHAHMNALYAHMIAVWKLEYLMVLNYHSKFYVRMFSINLHILIKKQFNGSNMKSINMLRGPLMMLWAIYASHLQWCTHACSAHASRLVCFIMVVSYSLKLFVASSTGLAAFWYFSCLGR